jgi:aspartate/tyrosine/aromatic aminotransferase
MESAQLKCAFYRYADPLTGRLQFDEMLHDVQGARPGDVVLLHACSHNPAAVDPTPDQWQRIALFMRNQSLLPLIDNAYQGLRMDIDEDPIGLRTVTSVCPESLVTTSFSKIIMMYAERVGMLSIVTESASLSRYVCDVAKVYVRRTYTSPAAFGARVVARVLTDADLRQEWIGELECLRNLLHERRSLLADALDAHQIQPELFPGLRAARGMFALSRLTASNIERLRTQQHIYVLDTGRVSLAALRKSFIERFCEGLAAIVDSDTNPVAMSANLG